MKVLDKFAKDDTGIAFFTVIMMTVVLFMLTTSLLVLQQYYVSMVSLRSNRVDATHIADAGLNDYLYHVKNDSTWYVDHSNTGLVPFGGGHYQVVATKPLNEPLTLTCTGSADSTVTIVATVRYPTFADYMFLADSSITFGTGAIVDGQVRSNGNVVNEGHITGKTYAVGTITGAGKFDQGKYPKYAPADFSQITVKMDDIATAAKSHSPSSYFPQITSSGYPVSTSPGYLVTFNGLFYTVRKVNSGSESGNFSENTNTTLVGTYTIPTDGAVYFEATVWIQGNYGANVTVASSKDIYFYGSYKRTLPTAKYVSGVISKTNIIVPSWYNSVPQDMTIEAAVLAQGGKFYADMNTGVFRNKLTVHGAAAYRDDGGFVTVSSNDVDVAGFHNRVYAYDQMLDINPPPFYPPTGDGSLKVATWVDSGGTR